MTTFSVDGLLTVVQYGVDFANTTAYAFWKHIDPLGLSEAEDAKPVYDPLGNYIAWQHAPSTPPNWYPPNSSSGGGLGSLFGFAQDKSCTLDRIPTNCDLAMRLLNNGSAVPCRNNDCGPQHVTGQDQQGNPTGGWIIPNGSGGAWITDGTDSAWLDPDDTEDSTALQAFSNSFGPVKKKKKRGTQSAPQSTGGSYAACRNLASIPESAGNDILSVSRQEGVDPTLLAVTWSNESSFSYNPPPYPRMESGRIVGYDVGLMGIATNIWNKSPYTDDLSNAFGTEIGAAQFGKRAPFNGNALDNLRLGARALIASSGWKGRPRKVSPRADAAGIFRAGSRKGEYWTRVSKFNGSFRAYDRLFNCMQGKPY